MKADSVRIIRSFARATRAIRFLDGHNVKIYSVGLDGTNPRISIGEPDKDFMALVNVAISKWPFTNKSMFSTTLFGCRIEWTEQGLEVEKENG